MLDLKELYWVAGLIEGEGSFVPDRRSNSFLRFSLVMVDLDVLKHAQRAINLGTIRGPHWNKKSTMPFWIWRINKDRDAAALMMTIYPLMGLYKREVISELLEEWRALPKVTPRGVHGKSGVLPKHSV